MNEREETKPTNIGPENPTKRNKIRSIYDQVTP
jgi:hypothetical protein